MQVNQRALFASIVVLILLLFAVPSNSQSSESEQPMVVLVHATNCSVCAKVRPLVNELEKEFRDKVQFVSLDVTDEASRKESRRKAKSLGIDNFLSFYEDQFPCVGVFKAKRKLVKELYGLKDREAYVSCIEKALGK